uniref:Uncharacterized protein n=1 Tax=Steinernema glaseri TaxID=37863 RepID=A0A1I7YZ99_9BILA
MAASADYSSSSESELEDPAVQQPVYIPAPEQKPESIIYGKIVKETRERLEKAHLLRTQPVTINAFTGPGKHRGEKTEKTGFLVRHGIWNDDKQKRAESKKASRDDKANKKEK